MNLDDLTLTFQAEVLPEYIDDNGHMNVSWYSTMFGAGTMSALSEVGLVFIRDDAHAEKRGVFALEQHIRYLSEVMLGEHVTVYTRYLARSEKRIHLLHFLRIQGRDKLAATGEVVMAYMDMNIRRMTAFPHSAQREIDRLVGIHANLDWAAPVCGSMKP